MKRCDSIPGVLIPASRVRVSPPPAVTWIGHSSTWAKRSILLPKILKHSLPGLAASSIGTSSRRHWPTSINHCVSSPRTTWPCKLAHEICVRTGDITKAFADLDRSIKSNPTNVDALVMRTTLSVKQGELLRALRDLDKAIEIEPKNASALTCRAGIVALQRTQDATTPDARHPELVLGLKEGDAKLYFTTPLDGRPPSAAELKQDSKTLDDLNAVIKAEPRNSSAYATRGIVFMQDHEYEKARTDLDHAISLDPKIALYYHNRSSLGALEKDYAKALADIDQAIRLAPTEYRFRLQRAQLDGLQRNNDDRVIEDVKLILAQSPRCAAAYVLRGRARTRKQEFDLAVADFSEAIRIDPEDFRVYAHRGFAWLAKNELTKALEDYDRALSKKPDDAAAPVGRSGLEQAGRGRPCAPGSRRRPEPAREFCRSLFAAGIYSDAEARRRAGIGRFQRSDSPRSQGLVRSLPARRDFLWQVRVRQSARRF